MSLHEDIQQKMKAAVVQASEQDMNDLPPSWIANQVYDAYGNTSVDAHVQYACMEHLKQMARKLLASKFHPDRDEIAQGELFPETLQTRYPIKRKRGEEPVYKLLDALSEIEGYWNVEQLEKAGGARFKHADTLRTFSKSNSQDGALRMTEPHRNTSDDHRKKCCVEDAAWIRATTSARLIALFAQEQYQRTI